MGASMTTPLGNGVQPTGEMPPGPRLRRTSLLVLLSPPLKSLIPGVI